MCTYEKKKKQQQQKVPTSGIEPPRYQPVACECNTLTHYTSRAHGKSMYILIHIRVQHYSVMTVPLPNYHRDFMIWLIDFFTWLS